MTLLRLIQRASILAGMTFASLSIHSNPAHAEDSLYCVTANNGKTECGTLKVVERACITTAAGSNVCGKYKPVTESQRQEARTPAPIAAYQKEVNKFVLTLESCKKVDENVRCQLKILNKGEKRNVYFSALDSSLIDLVGKSYPGASTDSGGGSREVDLNEMDSKTDIIMSITFKNIPGQVVKAQLLNLAFGHSLQPVQFRNVPISN